MRLSTWLALLLLVSTPFAAHAQREKLPLADLQIVEKTWPDAKRTSTGLRTQILVEGTGATPRPGDMAYVLYTGKLLNGNVFDENQDKERPFSCRVGRGEVIQAWDEGLQLMKVGEKRLLIVPFELGYGTRGRAPKIPSRATLVFEVELLSVKAAGTTPPTPTPPAAK